MLASRWRKQGASAVERSDFLLQTVEQMGQRQIDRMIGALGAVAKTKPAGYKRGRPRPRKPK